MDEDGEAQQEKEEVKEKNATLVKKVNDLERKIQRMEEEKALGQKFQR